ELGFQPPKLLSQGPCLTKQDTTYLSDGKLSKKKYHRALEDIPQSRTGWPGKRGFGPSLRRQMMGWWGEGL
ncbi:hypothetical protein NPIL_208971, partial [Nephila pilipes]